MGGRPRRREDDDTPRRAAPRRSARTDQLPARRTARRRHHRAGAGRSRCRRRTDSKALAPRRPRLVKIAIRVVLALVGIAIGTFLVFALREATLSTHQHVSPDSRLELVVSAHKKAGEKTQTLDELVQAQLLACRLEVNSDLVGDIEPEGDNRFRAVLMPSMDETNRRQFRGCVEDWVIDGVRLNVVRFEDIDSPD